MNQVTKNEIVVCVDGDGHFHVNPLYHRPKIVEAIKLIHDGDYLANMIDELPKNFIDQYLFLSDIEWKETIQQFVQRGTLEIIDIEL